LRSIKQAAAKPIEVPSLEELGLQSADVGESGSLSRVRRMYVPDKGRAQMIEGTVEEKAARLAQIIKDFAGGAG
jgi:electron transfer flavoprotein beta subunit